MTIFYQEGRGRLEWHLSSLCSPDNVKGATTRQIFPGEHTNQNQSQTHATTRKAMPPCLASKHVWFLYLFDLQTMTPDPFQKITQAGDERVLLHPRDADLPMAQLHRLPAHLLHQHTFCLRHEINGVRYSLHHNPGVDIWSDHFNLGFTAFFRDQTSDWNIWRLCYQPLLNHHISKVKMHLISALLQESLDKLPVGLCDDWWWEVGEFGLAESGAQVPGLLDVFLQWQSHTKSHHDIIRNTDGLKSLIVA